MIEQVQGSKAMQVVIFLLLLKEWARDGSKRF
jgi:hypothetical protein